MNSKDRFNPELYTFDPEADPKPKWMIFKNIAIMTVTFNRLEYTQKFIDSIYNKTHLPFTLYIFDQASTDGTSEYLDALVKTKKNIVVKKFKKNVGKGRALLYAKRMIEGDFFIYFDNDIEILSNYWLVHFLKAYYAYFLTSGNIDLALGLRMINQEEYGFRSSKIIKTYYIQAEENSLPRTSYNTSIYHLKEYQKISQECVCVGHTDHLCGGVWAISVKNFRALRWEEYYPLAIGGVDSFSSQECKRLNIELGYIENGPITRHNDWPYTEEKVQLYTKLIHEKAFIDRHYIKWSLRAKLSMFWKKLTFQKGLKASIDNKTSE